MTFAPQGISVQKELETISISLVQTEHTVLSQVTWERVTAQPVMEGKPAWVRDSLPPTETVPLATTVNLGPIQTPQWTEGPQVTPVQKVTTALRAPALLLPAQQAPI